MELNVFVNELRNALIRRGIPEATAAKHTDSIRRSFNDSDLDEIRAMESLDEINVLADSIATILNRKKAAGEPAGPAQQVNSDAAEPTRTIEVPAAKNPAADESDENIKDEYFEFDQGNEKTSKGVAVFWTVLILTLPISLALLAVIFGGFALLFAALFAVIVALVLLLVAVVAGGAACSLVGIIYGITQLFVFVEAGIYEIGLGIAVAGVALLLAVLLYNVAVRALPWVIRKLGVFFRFVCRKLKSLFLYARRECYKLS